MKIVCLALALLTVAYPLAAQTAPPTLNTPAATPPAVTTPPARRQPLQLQTLDPQARPDPFPTVNQKYFTSPTPSVATVDSYIKALVGFDPNRIWRVEAIEKTAAPGVIRVIVYLSDRAANAKVQTAVFFITPDGKYTISAGTGVTPFGAQPFAEARMRLQQRALGPYQGAEAKDLELVEFSDLQCVHCKEAEPTMKRLAQDFPKARIVFQPLPLTEIHPFAAKAADMGVCIAKSSRDAYFTYADAVYATQGALTAETGDDTLKAAIVKANLDPALVASCSTTTLATDNVAESVKLAGDLGISETPTLMVNGRPIPLSGVPYDTLKAIIVYQANLDGVSAAAAGNGTTSLIPR